MNLDFVRGTYWLGAIANALTAAQLLMPTGSMILGFPGLRAPGAAGQPAVVAAVLMLGWAVVLIWAHLRTRHRRTVLAIALGVVIVLAAVNVASAATGAATWSEVARPLAIQALLAVMFGMSIPIARRAAIESGVG